MILVMSISVASAISLDELLAGYDWSYDSGDINVTAYSSYGLDTGGSALFDLAVVNLTVDVTTAGTYTFVGGLKDFFGEEAATTELTATLGTGVSNVLINFSAKELEQDIHNLSVRISDSSIVFEEYDAYEVTIDSNYEPYPVRLTGIADTGVNTDGDGEFEKLEFNITVNATEAAQYEITGYLSDSANRIIKASKNHTLGVGISTIDIPFDSRSIRTAHMDGNFTLKLIEIKNTSEEIVKSYIQNFGANYTITNFDPEGVLITDTFSDKGIDTNANIYYDKVELNLTVYSDQSKTVDIEGAITDSYGNFVEEFNKTASLSSGNNVIEFELNGTSIYNTKINGPYRIGYVNVIEGSTNLDTVRNLGSLQNITSYANCERPAQADFEISAGDIEIIDLNNGLHTVKVDVRNTGDRTAFIGQVNVFDNLSNELGESNVYYIPKASQKTLTFHRLDISNSDTISVFLDFNDLVEEKNESNNMVKLNTTIGVNANSNTTSGDATLSVSFSSTVSEGNGGVSYVWKFGDGATSASQNPEHDYTTPGNHTASLTITDITGLTASDQISIEVMTPPDTTPPAGVSGLGETTKTNQTIRWDWTNPSDSDFSHVMVYLDGVFQSNTSNTFFNKLGLQANTTYTISTRTVDTNGNINMTWVNDSATTDETVGDITPPGPITGLNMPFNDNVSIYWQWTDPADGDYSHAIVYLNGVFQENTTVDHYATGLTPGTNYTISVKTVDVNGNINHAAVNDTRSTTGTAPVDTTPPAGVSNLANQDEGDDWIYWTWTNPTDLDFSHSVVYIDAVWKINTSGTSYNATGLSSGTSYEIEIETVDNSGNINTTQQTDTASTTTPGDTTPPGPVTGLSESTVTNESIRWDWTNPTDGDFSHVIVVIGSVNVANTSNNYYEATGLSADTSYTISLQTVDSSGNINTNSVQDSARTNANVQPGSDAVYADAGTPLFGMVGENIKFNGSYSYAESGINTYAWDFGDSSNGNGISPTHAYSAAGNYTAALTITSTGGNSSVDNVKVVITDEPSYNYDSYVGDFTKSTAQVEIIVRQYGEDNVNAFRKQTDYTKVDAIVKITGDSDITVDQVKLLSMESNSCVPIGNDYFKCQVFDSGYATESIDTYQLPISVYNDGASLIDSVNSYIVVDFKVPDINSLDADSALVNTAAVSLSYDLTDYSYLTEDGSGIGKIELYDGSVSSANYLATERIDGGVSETGSFSYDSGVADGAVESLSLCAVVYDKLGQSTEQCGISVVVDRKDPVIIANSLKIMKDGSEVTEVYDGDNVNISIQITEENGLDDSSVSADLSELNSAYSSVTADSCSASGNTWTCVWNDKEVDISADMTVNIDISFSDDAGNSNTGSESKSITMGNRNPVLTVSDISVNEGDIVNINPSTSDPDGDTVTVSYSGWMTADGYVSDYDDSGSHTVTVTADDGNGGVVSEDITITVSDVPVADLNIEFIDVVDGDNPLILEFVLKNIGEVAASGINWEVDTTNANNGLSGSVASLDVGAAVRVFSFINYGQSGTFDFTLNIDPNGNIPELDEANNVHNQQVTMS